VVGAGPAGSTAAYDCAKQGFKTLLLEKYKLPREKPCGGAVMYRALRTIGEKIPQELIERRIYGLRFLLPDGRGSEFVSDKLIGITVFRDRFDEFLARRATNVGVELIDPQNQRMFGLLMDESSAQSISLELTELTRL
jgi:flavin-dependent dehydrogenase